MPNFKHKHLTSAQAAALLGVGVSTVNRWARDGSLPPVTKVEGLRGPNLFSRSVIERLAATLGNTDGTQDVAS